MKRVWRRILAGLMTAVLVLTGLLPVGGRTVQAAGSDLVPYTEEQAYRKGEEFFRAWYTINKGNWALLTFGYDGPYKATVIKNRNSLSYQAQMLEWRIMTFNISDTLLHSNREKEYCEQLLFNLLYDENSQTFALSPLTDAVDANGKAVDVGEALDSSFQLGCMSEWEELGDLLDWLDHNSLINSPDVQDFINGAKAYPDFRRGLSYVANGAEVITNFTTLFEYFQNVSKIGAIAGKNEMISGILLDMAERTDNDAYKSSLKNFSDYLRATYTNMDPAMYTSSFVSRQFLDDTAEAIFAAILKKAAPGAQGAAALGKFGANLLAGTDNQYKKYNELEVYYDIETLLRKEVDQLEYSVEDGNLAGAERFNTAYIMLKNMINVAFDCYEEYLATLYRDGLLNQLLSGLGLDNQKYETLIANCETYRDSINELFQADDLNAQEAYEKAKAKYDPDHEQTPVIKVPGVQDRETENQENYDALAPTFCFIVDQDKTMDRDLEVYGTVVLEEGSFNINGHKLTVYGDLFVEEGKLTGSGILEVKGDLFQRGGTVRLPGASYLTVDGNYEQKEGALNVEGGSLTIKGSHIIGYEGIDSGSREIAYTITSSGEVSVGGDLLAYTLPENYSTYSINTFSSGRMEVGGNVRILSGYPLKGSEGFSLVLKGSNDLLLQNIGGGNVIIENASQRKITFRDTVIAMTLSGGDMQIIPENLAFSGKLMNDVEILGGIHVAYNNNDGLSLNGHTLTVNGDVTEKNYYYTNRITADGTFRIKGSLVQESHDTSGYNTVRIPAGGILDIQGDLVQNSGVYVAGGSLRIGGSQILGYEGIDAGSRTLAYTVTDGGDVQIAGDLVAYTLPQNYSTYSINTFSAGTMTVDGNVRILSGYPLSGRSGFRLTLTGRDDLTLQNIGGGDLVIENAAERQITFMNVVTPTTLSGGNLTAAAENLTFGGTLQNDVTINGNVKINVASNLDGHTLAINGDLLQTYQHIFVNGGTLDISGNYRIAAYENGAYQTTQYTSLNMTSSADTVSVGKNMLVDTEAECTLTAGTLYLKGNFTQQGGAKSFKAKNTHRTILDGTKLQRITFTNYPNSSFNQIEIHQYPENIIFTPEEAGAGAVVYCAHQYTEVRNAVDATCLEDGYTGDVYCLDCGALLETGSVIEAVGHTWIWASRIEPTCTEEGRERCRVCEVCGYAVNPVVIPATGHQFEADQPFCLHGCGTKNPDYKTPISGATVTGIVTKTYTGKAIKQTFQVVLDGVTLTEKTDYTVTYANNTDVGKATVTIKGTGAYKGTIKKTFKIVPKATTISKISPLTTGLKLTWKKVAGVTGYQVYRGSTKIATVKGDAAVTYSDAEAKTNGTKYTYKVYAYQTVDGTTYKASASANKSAYFLKKPTISSLTNKATTKMVAEWAKNTKATGYEIQYSTSSSFASPTTVKITDATTVTKTITKLTKGKTYYVRIRAYKGTSYSAWSAKKSVKITK